MARLCALGTHRPSRTPQGKVTKYQSNGCSWQQTRELETNKGMTSNPLFRTPSNPNEDTARHVSILRRPLGDVGCNLRRERKEEAMGAGTGGRRGPRTVEAQVGAAGH